MRIIFALGVVSGAFIMSMLILGVDWWHRRRDGQNDDVIAGYRGANRRQ